MEVINLPPEGSAEHQQAFQVLQEMGAQDFKGGRMPKSGEDVLVAVFNTPESAIKVYVCIAMHEYKAQLNMRK